LKALSARRRAARSPDQPRAEVLKLLLGLILIGAALEAFWRRQ
jgi:hypothetical protein